MTKRALITGVMGQDGSFLAEFLLSKGYQVFGFCRSNTSSNFFSPVSALEQIEMIEGDLTNISSVETAIKKARPDEVYNLASQSLPALSWDHVGMTIQTNCIGASNIFESIRIIAPNAKIYQASSSEMFGESNDLAHDEEGGFYPKNPYAATKIFAHHLAKIYRDSYGLFIANGILFNHESERRPLRFVTQKVAYGAACAALGLENSPDFNDDGVPIFNNNTLPMGNLNIYRDWGFAGDYVEAMWLMLQQDKADDFVIATGQLHSIEDLCNFAFGYVGKDWRDYVISKSDFVRPSDAAKSQASIAKAQKILGWQPQLNFKDLIERMVEFQINYIENKIKQTKS